MPMSCLHPPMYIMQVLFAVEAQEALLEAPWPPALLAMEPCKPMWITPTANRQLTQNLTMTKPAMVGIALYALGSCHCLLLLLCRTCST